MSANKKGSFFLTFIYSRSCLTLFYSLTIWEGVGFYGEISSGLYAPSSIRARTTEKKVGFFASCYIQGGKCCLSFYSVKTFIPTSNRIEDDALRVIAYVYGSLGYIQL